MKIFYEEGPLRKRSEVSLPGQYMRIESEYGPLHNIACFDHLSEFHPDAIIYTNSIMALSSGYGWNEETKQHDIFLRVGENGDFSDFAPIQYLTSRELRQGHNIQKLYIAGEFKDLYSQIKHEIDFDTQEMEELE